MRILLIGANVRAAAGSIRRLGGEPVAFDLDRDADLVAMADATQIKGADYPSRIWDYVRHLPVMPWMYTGAIENHPTVVETLSRRFSLLGNDPGALRLVRDPFWLAELVRGANLLMPDTKATSAQIPTDGSWLVKSLASGGGEGIKAWRGPFPINSRAVYFQARQPGRSLGATYIRDDSEVRLIGLTRQLVGRPGNRFAYRGSLGPWPVAESTWREVIRLGRLVADQAGLRGLFGLDLVESGGRVWLIEVNPRYTASVEILEAALGRSILADHLRAFGLTLDEPQRESASTDQVVGKAILFARSSGHLRDAIPVGTSDLADIPHAGTRFDQGQPIMTVFGRGNSAAACARDLAHQARAWSARVCLIRAKLHLSIDQQEDGCRGDQEAENHSGQAE